MTQSEGPAPAGEDAARAAVRARMAHLRLSQRVLAQQSGVDKNTVGYYLSGATGRPYAKTVAALEDALGWPVGSIEAIARGADARPYVTMRSTEDNVLPRTAESRAVSGRPPAGVVDLPPEVVEGLTEAQAAEVRAHAYAEAMRRRREIIHGA